MADDENGRKVPAPPMKEADLEEWYRGLTTRRVDLVGDFAGGERFFIHGDALVMHCMHEGRVKMHKSGFQLLHLVYEVEKFLTELVQRGCKFDIIFFSEYRDILSWGPNEEVEDEKAVLATEIVRGHLERCFSSEEQTDHVAHRSASQTTVRLFDSPVGRDFGTYLQERNIRFALLHEGFKCDEASGIEDSSDEDSESDIMDVDLKGLIHIMVTQGYPVALMNNVAFQSSKVFVDLIAGSYNKEATASLLGRPSATQDRALDSVERLEQRLLMRHVMRHLMSRPAVGANLKGPEGDTITAREALALLSVRAMYRDAVEYPQSSELMEAVLTRRLQEFSDESGDIPDFDLPPDPAAAAAIMLHFSALRELSLAERARLKCSQAVEVPPLFNLVLMSFNWRLVDRDDTAKQLAWDLYDGIDGDLLQWMIMSPSSWGQLPPRVHARARLLIELSIDGLDEELRDAALDSLGDCLAARPSQDHDSDQPAEGVSVLPFSHAVLDRHLESVHIDTSATGVPSADSSRIFKELTHWHNKKQIDPRKIPFKRGFFASKRHQRLMADIVSYSSSLTGANGKNLNPEVVVASGPSNLKATKQPKQPQQQQKKAAKPGSGTAKALEAAKSAANKKLEKKNESALGHWKTTAGFLEDEENLVKRYRKTIKYLEDCSADALAVVEPEARLYLCHTLWLMWEIYCDNSQKSKGIDLVAMLWDQMLRLPCLDGQTAQINKAARCLAALMGLPLKLPILKSPSRQLSFDLDLEVSLEYKIPMHTMSFQLQHSGPYMKRDFDSQPDNRVASFRPDAWQRDVLDAIDANQSLFVVAPTSAGKTFISFYAMQKILQSNDDDVLVYVAPTKALVNQIAAEISARYTKSYRGEGKSVWAIHTRDYRINNPTGCQILVTVPHILQIMLLSPSNSDKPNAWSRRVKRIVFDEVHCIGQAEDGIVWEQLLLLSPCPIIALSATVGNANEFCDWLAASQAQKGHELKMVVHDARYSDLRKFLYLPPATEPKALKKHDRLPVPGLDQGVQPSRDFAFIHPIAALVDFTRSNLRDVSLEPRDCYTLWQAMYRLQSKEFPLNMALHPKSFLPEVPGKADIVRWETALKSVLAQWMLSPNPPLEGLRKELLDPEMSAIVFDDFKRGSVDGLSGTIIPLVYSLHEHDSLPALVFNYDRVNCEHGVKMVMQHLENEEAEYKNSSKDWARKLEEYDQWQRTAAKAAKMKSKDHATTKADKSRDDPQMSKMEKTRSQANVDSSPWESFDPKAPLEQYSFADKTKMSNSELEQLLESLSVDMVAPWLSEALKRGLGVHHAGLNRRYRQIVEILFRKKFLRVVIATGTLALGINMPCKTVVFGGDSVFLTALNYRQASGRAGRRGFDLLGNVVFTDISPSRVFEIMSSHLPDLKGQFPSSTTLILRLLSLLHGTNQSQFAVDAVNSLLSQTRLYLGGPEAQMSIKHHLRFSIEYLRWQHLVSEKGAPLNFAGLVSHLYFAENSAFAFHALLKAGYFHRLCSKIEPRRSAVLLELMLVMSHLFGRQVIRGPSAEYTEEVIHHSPSVVFLPPLPQEADEILTDHNQETLELFEGYVRSYISQHLEDIPDDTLPLSKHRVKAFNSKDEPAMRTRGVPSTIRSPFVTLSGHTDKSITSIHELCASVRAGVFLEESAIPHIPVDSGEHLNAYLYDFFKNGDLKALTRFNRIKAGDVWFLLKDFSLVLATIVTSLSNYVRADGAEEDAVMLDEADEDDEEMVRDENRKEKGDSADEGEDWLAEDDSDSGDESERGGSRRRKDDGGPGWERLDDTATNGNPGREESLVNVLKAFTMLKDEFEEKFRKIGA